MASPASPKRKAPAPADPAERNKRVTNLRRRLRRLDRERDKLRDEIGESLFKFTSRCVERGKFPVVVEVKDGYCGACHTKLPYQTLTDLECGELVQCDNCSRILYDPESDGA